MSAPNLGPLFERTGHETGGPKPADAIASTPGEGTDLVALAAAAAKRAAVLEGKLDRALAGARALRAQLGGL